VREGADTGEWSSSYVLRGSGKYGIKEQERYEKENNFDRVVRTGAKEVKTVLKIKSASSIDINNERKEGSSARVRTKGGQKKLFGCTKN